MTWESEPGIGTDKGGYIGEHDYVKGFYEQEFVRYQDKDVTLLEIGIFGGASLDLWSRYFTKAQITGIDVADNIDSKYRNLDRVTHIINDAYDQNFSDTLPNFDIVIDDGPHTLDSMLKCIDLYLPKVNDGGVFIIEDVQDTSWFTVLTDRVPEELKSNIQYLDIRENKGRWDDLMFIIRK